MGEKRKAPVPLAFVTVQAIALAVVLVIAVVDDGNKQRSERRAAAEAFAARTANSLEEILLSSEELAALPKEFIVQIEGEQIVAPPELGRLTRAEAFDPWSRLDPIGREALRRAEAAAGAEAAEALTAFATREGVPKEVRDWALLGAGWAQARSGAEARSIAAPSLESFDHPGPFGSRLALALRLGEAIDAETAFRSLPTETARLVLDSVDLDPVRREQLAETIAEADRIRTRNALAERAFIEADIPRRGITEFGRHLLIRAEPGSIAVLTRREAADLANQLVEVDVRPSPSETGTALPALGGALFCAVPDWADQSSGNYQLLTALVLLGTLMLGLWLNLRSVRQERRAMAARSEFLTMVTHELKTPVAGIHVIAELLEGPRGAQEESRTRWLGRLRSECMRLGVLIQNVLDLGRSERGEQVHRPELLDLSSTVGEIVHQFSPIAEQAQMKLTTEGLDQSIHVRADRDAIRQCLVNLLDNARKYAGQEPEVRVVVERTNGKAQLSVIDKGPGVWPGERNRIFERFERGDAERTGTTPGLGIGLHLAKTLVERDGGTLIHAELRDGERGAHFVATWPLIDTLEETA